MADAIPTEPGKQPKVQSTVIVQQPASQWGVLKQMGWWSKLDTTILALVAVCWITLLYWKLFGDPEFLHVIAFLLITIVMLLFWIAALIFRCSWFVIRMQADINLLPSEAARIAVAYLQGQPPPAQAK